MREVPVHDVVCCSTVILTTHYMDEADRLSDRVVIMVKGRVVCDGSPEFLKKRFGTGFLLTVSLRNGAERVQQRSARVLDEVRQTVPEAQLSGSAGAQFVINLPHESRPRQVSRSTRARCTHRALDFSFAQLFNTLETRSAALEIDSFGLGVNTLEQVFIKVGEKAAGQTNDALRERIRDSANIIAKGDSKCAPTRA